MIIAIAALTLFSQRSQAEIEARRHNSAAFFPIAERMMRATDKQLISLAGSLKPDERGAAVDEIVDRKLKSAAPSMVKQLHPKTGSNTILFGRLQGLTVQGLGRLGNPAAIPALRKTLKSGPTGVRILAAYSLGSLGDKQSAADMRAVFPSMKEPQKRGLVKYLAALRDKGSEPVVRGMLEKARDQNLRTTAAEALGVIGNQKTTVPALIQALKDDYPDVRRAAANSLAKLGGSRAVPALKVALTEQSPQASNAPGMERRSHEAIKDALKTLGAG